MSHDTFREYDASYVLGSLSPADRRAFEEHLRSCAECALTVRELAGMPGLLASVPRDLAEAELEGPGPVPETLLPRLVREVRRRRVRRMWTVGATAAVTAAALTLGGVGLAGGFDAGTLTTQGSPSGQPSASTGTPAASTGTPAAMQQVGQQRLHATVAFTSRDWGTAIDLTCAYDSSAPYAGDSRPTYVLVVRRADGATQRVATWRAVPGREMTLDGASSWDRAAIAAVEVQTQTGRPVLELAG